MVSNLTLQRNPIFWDQPIRMWNVDETSLHTSPARESVLGSSERRVSGIRTAEVESTHTTGIACVSASGHTLPLEFVRRRDLPIIESDVWMFKGMPPETRVYLTENAYISKVVFRSWFSNWVKLARQVVRSQLALRDEDDVGPLLLFLDGAASHVDIELIHEALLVNVTILMFPSHTTTAIQVRSLPLTNFD